MKAGLIAIAGAMLCGLALTGCKPAEAPAPTPPRTPTVIPLWPADLEIAKPELTGPEETGPVDHLVGGRPWTYVANVSRPTLTVYPPKGRNTGAAMMVFPGGGYQVLAIDLEGTEICDWVTSKGMTCVLLKYRVPHSGESWSKVSRRYKLPDVPLALQDAQRAMRLVRQRAAEFALAPERSGVIGFSAGGHLVADISNADTSSYAAVDAADALSSRPSFAVGVYPGHLWSGQGMTLRPFNIISRSAPPTLLIHAQDDAVDDPRHSIAYARALEAVGVPVQTHIFPKGGHAFGMRPTGQAVDQWPDVMEAWLRSRGVLPKEAT